MYDLSLLLDIRKLESFLRYGPDREKFPVEKPENNSNQKTGYTMKYNPETKEIEVYKN